MSGWIKLHRGLLDWEWYDDANTSRTFIHCLLRANHKDKKWKGKTIKRGQFASSFDKIAAELGLSRQKIRTAMSNLASTSDITIETSTQHTVFTVKNYDSFQSATNEPTNDQPTKQPTSQPTDNHKQEVKEFKEENIGAQADAFAGEETPAPSVPNCPFGKIVDEYHKALPMMTQVKVMSDARKNALRSRWREDSTRQTVDWWSRYFNYVATSDFLTGKATDFCADFEWIIKSANFLKIIEGKYANKDEQYASK